MDRMIYIAMTGARQVMEQQATTAHNLANINTTGFRAQIDNARAVAVQGPSMSTRTFVVEESKGNDFTQGVVAQTGRDLDVAVRGPGWIAMQAEDGSEVYTRNGNFHLTENGLLTGAGGMAVAGEGGPITVPAQARLQIAGDGAVSGIDARGAATLLGRIRLVNPPAQSLKRGEDGLFRAAAGAPPQVDAAVKLASGSLESSNVNAVDAMVSMITLARAFDLQMSVLKNAENNAAKATQILALN